MAFWSSQTLEGKLSSLIDPAKPELIDCNSVTLRVGGEIFITPHIDDVFKTTKRLLTEDEPFLIPPGQFAFVLTEEGVKVPAEAMAFISMKSTFKMRGLINVSGFHVDPGWDGPLIFAIFNSGPSPVHLQRGMPLFLIWFADLDHPSEKRKTQKGESGIPPKLISNLTGSMDSLHQLDKRLKEETEKRRDEHEKLVERIHTVEKSQDSFRVTAAVILTLLGGMVLIAIREPVLTFFRTPAQSYSQGPEPSPKASR